MLVHPGSARLGRIAVNHLDPRPCIDLVRAAHTVAVHASLLNLIRPVGHVQACLLFLSAADGDCGAHISGQRGAV